jgi:uncharacterized membrane protein
MANEEVLKTAGTQEVPENPTQNVGGAEADEKFFAAIGYFGPLFIVPLLVKPKSEYCKFHAKQSMALFILMLLVFVILYMIPAIGSLLTLVLFAIYVLAIYKSFNGDLWAIPFLSKFAGKVNVDALYDKAGLAVSSISGMKESVSSMAEKAGNLVQNAGAQVEAPKETIPSPAPTAPAAPTTLTK